MTCNSVHESDRVGKHDRAQTPSRAGLTSGNTIRRRGRLFALPLDVGDGPRNGFAISGDAHRITKAEYDEAPELTKEMLDRAEIRHGDRIIKRGRPPLENPKQAVKLRLDHDVLAAYRKTGSGWQTRINADLRKAARKLTG